jgi:hypothetical protein
MRYTKQADPRRPRWATSITIACLLVGGAYVATPSLFSRIVLAPIAFIGKLPSPLDARDYRNQDDPSEMVTKYGLLILCAVFYSLLIQWITIGLSRRARRNDRAQH